MFSANVTPDAKESSLKAGVDEFLPKPVKIDVFLEVLNKLLTRKKTEKNPRSNSIHSVTELVEKNHAVLELATLLDLEGVSADPAFLDELIQEFIIENKKTILKFEDAMHIKNIDDIKDILHYLKGSAVSVGAMELLQYCKKIEKLNSQEIDNSKENIIHSLKSYANNLCGALENYRFQRRKNAMTLVSTDSLVKTLALTSSKKNHNQNINSQ
jgi:two-component system sensor histidine kinase RpfC